MGIGLLRSIPVVLIALPMVVLLVIGCSGQSPASDAATAPEPTASSIPRRETEAATAEARRKSSAGDCEIGPGAQCEGADFEGKDLAATSPINMGLGEGVDLSGANLRFANLRGVNLLLADLSDADLTGADMTGANLNNVNFKNATLRDANLTDANLSWANLKDADMEGAIFCNTLLPDGGTAKDDC